MFKQIPYSIQYKFDSLIINEYIFRTKKLNQCNGSTGKKMTR